MAMTLKIALFTFATEVFREQADKDYIAARSCYRMKLREQFLWASLQACEKYLKATLLFNERSARYDPAKYNPQKKHNPEFGHNLCWLFENVKRIGDLPLGKAVWLKEFFEYLTTFGNNRYLSKSTYAFGDELRRLDEAVWLLRRVCQNFDWTPDRANAVNLRPVLLAQVADPLNRKNPARYRPLGAIDGFVEKILKAPADNPTRQALVWNNMFFGNKQRHSVAYSRLSSSENPPHTRDWFNKPAITGNIDYYIKLK